MKNSLYGGLKVVTSAALFSATVTLLLGVSISSGLAAQNDTTWQNAPSEQQVKSLSLREAILRAFARNPEILQSSAQIQVGKGQIDAATAAWFPQISLQGTTGKNHRSGSDYNTPGNPTSAGISLSQLLYDFGKTGGSIDEQKQLTEAYQYQLQSVMTDVGTQTIQAYLQSKRYQDLSQSVVKNIASLEKVRDMAKMRADAGLSSQSDVLQAETRIAGMNATYEQYRAQQRTAQAELSVLTGVVAESLPDLPQALTKQKVKPQHISYKDSSMVRSAESKQQAAAQRVRQAEAQHWPTISVQAGRSRYNDNDQSYWDDQVQLVVQAPLYQGGGRGC
ncbi:Outer membrane efflux protein BepC precursor [Budvicia aquatica]|uniref:Outer membrane efflux protein BepC n=1 Tax=Budvicia aquatica TaxID=82979 RepID=A0A484ZP77_9GAMM|nr:Outer membrane efflux protein BepC precursor [Budvicia aquatica]